MASRKLSDEEARAWAKVASTVKPIGRKAADLAALAEALGEGPADPPAPPAKGSTLPPETPKPPKPPAPPANRGSEKKVRRGKLEIAGSFDLHGHTQATAAAALPLFLERQQAVGARCVLVITGKGRGGEGVLRRNFLLWLETPAARRIVSGYAEAHPRHGGAGAFYLFLRQLSVS
ncbi:Smr/MutS family protein [Hyphomonas sp.]|uniref:Smr/MutS family protein n=1 Tax=Hyphomonas sp. TaxID=87 RepID=UPI003918CE78